MGLGVSAYSNLFINNASCIQSLSCLPFFLYHPYMPLFLNSQDFSFTCIRSTTVLNDTGHDEQCLFCDTPCEIGLYKMLDAANVTHMNHRNTRQSCTKGWLLGCNFLWHMLSADWTHKLIFHSVGVEHSFQGGKSGWNQTPFGMTML